jgi:Zn-dependent peptidase ImmA (M78 family)/transcriptional regulator with XRE-family HTH domain
MNHLDNNSPTAIGSRIRTQRTTVGMTVSRLASSLGVSRNTIANYETGKTEPSGTDLLKIAEALGCGVMELLTGTSPSAVPRFAFRAHRVLKKNPDITVLARKYLRALSEIEEITGTDLRPTFRQIEIAPDDPHVDKTIEDVARELRESSGFSESGPERIVSALEELGVRSLFFHWPGEDRLDGFSTVHGAMCLVMLNDNPRVRTERIIFSAAHELGHLVMHPNLFTQSPDERIDLSELKRFEREADLFAGCFLVPSEDLRRTWREERLDRLPIEHALILLKRVHPVSFWCLGQRVRQAGLADIDHSHLIRRVKASLKIRRPAKMEELEPEPLGCDVLQRSTRFERLVRSAFIQEKIGISKVAEMFQIPVDEAKERTARWLRPPIEQGSLN